MIQRLQRTVLSTKRHAVEVHDIDRWSYDRMGELLASRLGDQPRSTGSFVSPTMAPALAYGRHRGPETPQSRRAAVVLALYRRDQQWWVPLTLRPQFLTHHGGQICLPGGRVEAGETVCEAAKREFLEELGQECCVTRFCGELAPQYVYASNNRVHPVVVLMDSPSGPWHPDPAEVELVLEMPLSSLLSRECQTTLIREKPLYRDGQIVDQFSFRAPAFRTDAARTTAAGAIDRNLTSDNSSDELACFLEQTQVTPIHSRLIWGATAMMLEQLVQLLLPLKDCPR